MDVPTSTPVRTAVTCVLQSPDLSNFENNQFQQMCLRLAFKRDHSRDSDQALRSPLNLPNDKTPLPLNLRLNSRLIFVGLPTHSKLQPTFHPRSPCPHRACASLAGGRSVRGLHIRTVRFSPTFVPLMAGCSFGCLYHDHIRPSTLIHHLSVCCMFSNQCC